ncbi:MAG: EAL domain-containing protein [Acidobacteriota bacterium]|jgi:diguanylate cyclase (GGDEF)-like protein/PAS domain S-box-containing protein
MMQTKHSSSSSSSSDRTRRRDAAGRPSEDAAVSEDRDPERAPGGDEGETASAESRPASLQRPPVLVIDESRERGQSMCRLLRAEGHQVAWSGSYARTPDGLADRSGDWRGYATLVVGLPEDDGAAADDLIAALEAPRFRHCGLVLVLGHGSAPLREWTAERPRSALVLEQDLDATLAATVERVLRPPLLTVPKASRYGQGEPIRVLFVDDSKTVRESYGRSLRGAGYEVETAGDCGEGFDKASQGNFDLAVIDYFMPGATGDVLCRRLARDPRTASICTVVITSAYLDQVIHDSIAAGALDCVFKNEAEALFLTRIASVGRAIQAQRAERSRRRHLGAILESVGDGVFGVDRNGRISFINRLAKNLLGYDDDDSLLGGHPHSLFHYAHEDGTEIPLEQCLLERAYLSGEELRGWEATFWHRSGQQIPVECTVFPLTVAGCREGSVVAFRDISERRQLYRRLWWLATHDPLTGLRNRRFFEEQLLREIQRVRETGQESALLVLDLDHFRYINETAGPAVGDQVLVDVARELKQRVGESDLLARLGGDEFAAIIQDVDGTAACRTAETLRQALRECTFDYEGESHMAYASIGVEMIGPGTLSTGDALANADIACNLAKERGRNRIQAYDPKAEDRNLLQSELGWLSRLRNALRQSRFKLHFQPIVALADVDADDLPNETGSLWKEISMREGLQERYEVLLRLEEPSGAAILPGRFLSTAQRFNLMLEIDLWVISHALETLARVVRQGRDVTLFINLAAQTLHAESLFPFITVKLRELGLDPGLVIFEVTETDAIQNLEHARALAEELRCIGCRLALDDFGSGFSSFQHLKHLPVDLLKIDGLFIRGMETDSADLAMVDSMDQIAHSLGCRTVAEHVESAAVVKVLKTCGVDFIQGNYISPPLASLDRPTSR